MAVLNQSEITSPTLPKETVEVPSLKGEVIVQGLMLKDRLELFFDEAGGHAHLSKLLSKTVVDAKGLPVFSQEQWEVFGSSNFTDALMLFTVSKRINGLDAEVSEKN